MASGAAVSMGSIFGKTVPTTEQIEAFGGEWAKVLAYTLLKPASWVKVVVAMGEETMDDFETISVIPGEAYKEAAEKAALNPIEKTRLNRAVNVAKLAMDVEGDDLFGLVKKAPAPEKEEESEEEAEVTVAAEVTNPFLVPGSGGKGAGGGKVAGSSGGIGSIQVAGGSCGSGGDTVRVPGGSI